MPTVKSQSMNRTVLITGAAIRLGRVIAETLARAGWDVVVHAHRSATQADELCDRLHSWGRQAWRVSGDLFCPEAPDTVFDAAIAAAGRLDALVNNASLFARQSLADTPPEIFDRMWRINAYAPILLAQRLFAHLAERSALGCVVNMLDQRIAHPSAGATPYVLSKKALESYTLCAARELAPTLRINAVAPGAVLMPSATDAKEPAGAFPLGLRPTPAQVAEAVRYLFEADAVTGQILYVDGGQHLCRTVDHTVAHASSLSSKGI